MAVNVFSPTADGVSILVLVFILSYTFHILCNLTPSFFSLLQYTEQILAALLAPFFMSLGFFIWDHRWTSSGASAFALNSELCMMLVILCTSCAQN